MKEQTLPWNVASPAPLQPSKLLTKTILGGYREGFNITPKTCREDACVRMLMFG